MTPEEGEDEAEEGRVLYRQHLIRERDPRLARSKKNSAASLACEVCGFEFERTYGDLGRGFVECHHLVPLSGSGPVKTKLDDLALLCSNCHRMAHKRRPWPSLQDLRALVRDQTR